MGTNRNRSGDVLRKQDALGLNDEKIDELVDITNNGIQCLLGDRVVLPGAKLRSESVVDEGFTGSLGGDGDGKDHPCKLERPPEHIEVPNREDERNDGRIGNGRGTWESYQYEALALGVCNSRGLFHDNSSEKKE